MAGQPSITWQNVIHSKLVFNRRAPPKNLHVPFTPNSDSLSKMSSYVSTPSSTRNNNSLSARSENKKRGNGTRVNGKSNNGTTAIMASNNRKEKEKEKEKETEKEKEKEKEKVPNSSNKTSGVGQRLSIRIPGKTRKYRKK